ncbi:MAG TPA: helix-turn-helix transcriptional regulator [Vicinamibacterales bacterium]
MPKLPRPLRSFGANVRDVRLTVPMTPEELAARHRKRRPPTGPLTQSELAARLGFSRPTPVSYWERSGHLPDPHTIVKIAAALGCAPATLLRDVVDPYDALRGGKTLVLSLPSSGALVDLTADDERWLQLGRVAARLQLRRLFEAQIEATARLLAGPPRGLADVLSHASLRPADARFHAESVPTRARRSPAAPTTTRVIRKRTTVPV